MLVRSGGQAVEVRGIPQSDFVGYIPSVYFAGGGLAPQPQFYFDQWLTDTGARVDLHPDAIYSSQPAVRTVVSFRARNVAQVPLHAFAMGSSGARERSRDTPLANLMRRPGPDTTPFEFVHTLMHDVDLWDRYAAVLSQGETGEWELTRLPPRTWKFERDGADRPARIRAASGKSLSLEQVLWIDNYPTAARSPIECIKDILIEEAESSAARRDMWKHRARVPGVISRPANAPPWGPDGRDNFRRSWQEYAAGGGRTGKTPVLEDGMFYTPLQTTSSTDAQQIEARKLSLRFVASFWHVPPVMVGDAEASNYSNVVAFREQLYNDTLGTDFAKLSQAINHRVTPTVAGDSGEFVEFNVGEKLRLSFELQADVNQKALGTPYKTINEVRKEQNLPPVPNGDQVTIPINVAPKEVA